MFYLIIFIIILTIILYMITKDKKMVLNLTGKITVFSGLLTLLIGFIIRYIMINHIFSVNVSLMTVNVLAEFLRNSLILISLGFIELSCTSLIKS